MAAPVAQTSSAASPGLGTPLQFLKGIGPRRAELLARKGLETVADALQFFPYRHEDRTRFTPLAELRPGEMQTCAAVVTAIGLPPPGRARGTVEIMLRDASGFHRAVFFNGGYLARRLRRGQRLVLHGKVGLHRGAPVLHHPEFEVLEPGDEQIHAGRFVPVYSVTEGISRKALRTLLWHIVSEFAAGLPETLPEDLRRRRQLVSRTDAIRAMHFPESEATLAAARHRLVFEEFLLLQLGFAILRARTARARGFRLDPAGRLAEGLRASLPYRLTAAQERVWGEIRRDMAAPAPMHRLLQGDVGSGKTIVAGLAAVTAIESGFQAAIMAPTEILAEQHFMTFQALLAPLGIPVTLLTSSLPARARARGRAAAASGEAGCVVGTHALVQEGVTFQRLGLAIVDEQHRFGVEQRARLKALGAQPDVLVMTATPIPRTLALALHGDLDVSVLDELPPGRTPVKTRARTEAARERVYGFLRDQLRAGRQAYVVYPLVEESETLDVKAATERARHLAAEVFPEFTVGLLHGRLGYEEKDAIMRRFKAGEIQILVATTVIEVGIDVPNASVMVIEHAERFGLAQLHQLRGRVGRGPWPSYCILMVPDRPGEEAQRRLDAIVTTTDGFRLAEVDLAIRGPGDFFGTRQSGLPELRVADILRDGVVLEEARREADAIVADDPGLRAPAHRALRDELVLRWRERLALASVG